MRLVRYTYPSFGTVTPAVHAFRRSPWSGFESEIDRLFGSVLTESGSASGTRFPVDLYEDKANTYVRAELPGLNRDDINVEMTDGDLTIAGVRKTASTDGKPEESFSFSRAIRVADDVQADQVTAAYVDGVLTVTLPKREEVKPKKINVAVK